MKMLWRGNLIFELINIPIRLYAATRRRGVEFRLLHEPDLSPIRMERICSEEGRAVPADEIVRGYDTGAGWVVIDPDELDSVSPILTRTIEIREFVAEHEIDSIYYRKPYYLAPGEGAEELYLLLREAIRRSGRVGVVEFVLLRRQHLAILRPHGEALLLETLYYPDEIADEGALSLPATAETREGEIRMAVELIEHRSRRPFEIESYRDEYRDRVLELISEKISGRTPVEAPRPRPPEPTQVIDLTARLRASLERVRGEGPRRAA